MSYDTTQYPYRDVVYIIDSIGSQYFQASGALISPDEVLTASHVVYSSTHGTAGNIAVIPAFNAGSTPYGTATATSYHFMPIADPNDTLTGDQSQIDYAVIHLSQPFTGLGTFGLLPGFSGGTANLTGYPGTGNGYQQTLTGTYTQDPTYTLLDGPALGPGSSGGPLWVSTTSGAGIIGVVSTAVGNLGYEAQITPAVAAVIGGWVAQDDASGGNIAIADTTRHQQVAAPATPYVGPVAGLSQESIDITPDSLNVTARTDGWFIHTGSGTDAIAVLGGTNVLDGGTGSNFLVGGSGTDTFFVDDRGAAAAIWSTLDNFHAGDSATVWGVTAADFQLQWQDQQGASGYTGLTLHATDAGKPEASLTVVGYTSADLGNGRLGVSFGVDPTS
ncbi:MAG: trypsin-like serine protease, partial [Mycobacteriaceae bacterium]|nr:trypsin-like serine protease [Mycobacteriaceae bacterium]